MANIFNQQKLQKIWEKRLKAEEVCAEEMKRGRKGDKESGRSGDEGTEGGRDEEMKGQRDKERAVRREAWVSKEL